jgi:hypothetical protein
MQTHNGDNLNRDKIGTQINPKGRLFRIIKKFPLYLCRYNINTRGSYAITDR